MKERERQAIEHIMALIKSFQNKRAEAGEQDGLPVSSAEEIQSAREIMDFMEEMPGGFLICQADGKEEIIYANQGLLRLFRCGDLKEFRELTGNSFRGLVHPEDLDAVEESIRQRAASSRFDLDYVEYRIIRKDGAVRRVEDYGHFVRSKTVGDVFCVFLVDATEKIDRQKEENARLLQEREQSEEKWMHLMEEYDQERTLVNQEQHRRLDVIRGLGINHESIFYLDLDEDKILPYRHSGRTESVFDTLHHTLDYSKWISQYIQDWVHPEDRERMERETASDAIRRRLEDSASFALNYRVVDEGETQYLQLRFDSVGEREQPAQIVMGCRRMDEELRRELEQKQALEEPAAPPAEEELPEKTPDRCRILLVEDNAFNREIETEILKSLDFPVETAGNGREAVKKLQAAGPEHFGLILMDIQMPVMNGWEAAEAIRALPDPALSRIPIVALSANMFESDVQKSLELGMNAHLAKPVDVPELLRTIDTIMRLEK